MIKTKRSDELRDELKKTDERIGELRPQLGELTLKLDKANSKFLAKEIAIDEALSAKHAHALIDETIKSLEANRLKLATELEDVLAVEEHAASIAAMKTLVAKRRRAYDEYVKARETLSNAADTMLTVKTEFEQTEKDFAQHFHKLDPGIDKWPVVHKNLRTKFEAAMGGLERSGISYDDVDFVLGKPLFPTLRHEAVVTAAENHQIWEQRQAENDERLRRKDQVAALAWERKKEAEKAMEAELRVAAFKQQHGRGWRSGVQQGTK